MMGMIITISGYPGSGKTTAGRMVASKLGYSFLSMGDLRGKVAMKRGLTIDQLNEIGSKEPWTDREIDKRLAKIGRKGGSIVIDSWIAFHFIPKSFKVFLTGDERVRAERIFRDQRPDEERRDSADAVLEAQRRRIENTDARYRKWYGVSFRDMRHYDLVIDTTKLTARQVADKILREARKRMKKK
jgi:predicted cytidylate kinase